MTATKPWHLMPKDIREYVIRLLECDIDDPNGNNGACALRAAIEVLQGAAPYPDEAMLFADQFVYPVEFVGFDLDSAGHMIFRRPDLNDWKWWVNPECLTPLTPAATEVLEHLKTLASKRKRSSR